MLSFKQFITEQEDVVLSVDKRLMLTQIDDLNSELDSATERAFVNSSIYANTLRNILERYGIVLPAPTVMPMLASDAETVYTLGETEHYLYITHDTNDDGLVEGYAQVVTEDELKSLSSMDSSEWMEKGEEEDDAEEGMRRTPYARRDDDSGNGNDVQYADPSYDT